jgi:hypothetical protein
VVLPDISPGRDTALDEIAKRAGDTRANIIDYIQDARDYFLRLGAEVWLCDQAQLFTSYRFDDVVVAAMYNHRRGQAPTLPVILAEQGGELFDFFVDDFQFIIDNYAVRV